MPGKSIQWKELKPSTIVAALVFIAIGLFFVFISAYTISHRPRWVELFVLISIGVVGLFAIYASHSTLRNNRISNYKLGLVFTITGFYVIMGFVYLVRTTHRHYQNYVIIICCFYAYILFLLATSFFKVSKKHKLALLLLLAINVLAIGYLYFGWWINQIRGIKLQRI